MRSFTDLRGDLQPVDVSRTTPTRRGRQLEYYTAANPRASPDWTDGSARIRQECNPRAQSHTRYLAALIRGRACSNRGKPKVDRAAGSGGNPEGAGILHCRRDRKLPTYLRSERPHTGSCPSEAGFLPSNSCGYRFAHRRGEWLVALAMRIELVETEVSQFPVVANLSGAVAPLIRNSSDRSDPHPFKTHA